MIENGIKGRFEQVVTSDLTAARVGSGLAEVFATPMMIAMVEKTCYESVLPFLEEGQSTVGTHVNISHSSATPVGMKVWCESELVEVDRRRLLFKVTAYDEYGIIGEGTHERFVIDINKFQAKTDSNKKL